MRTTLYPALLHGWMLLLLALSTTPCHAFVIPTRPSSLTTTTSSPTTRPLQPSSVVTTTPRKRSTTRLHVLLDVPDGFFTVTFFASGLLLSISKSFARVRMEENAWEQRLAAARQATLKRDPTLTDLDVRRAQAALEWSAYGEPAREEAARSRARVKVMEREDDEDEDDDPYSVDSRRESSPVNGGMTDAEIQAFELEYGVTYDPYYDEPYTEEELPSDIQFTIDKRYGDRIYANGEVFYKHGDECYYRQGAKPRNVKFWE